VLFQTASARSVLIDLGRIAGVVDVAGAGEIGRNGFRGEDIGFADAAAVDGHFGRTEFVCRDPARAAHVDRQFRGRARNLNAGHAAGVDPQRFIADVCKGRVRRARNIQIFDIRGEDTDLDRVLARESLFAFDLQSIAIDVRFDQRKQIVVGIDLDRKIFLGDDLDDKLADYLDVLKFGNLSFLSEEFSRTFNAAEREREWLLNYKLSE